MSVDTQTESEREELLRQKWAKLNDGQIFYRAFTALLRAESCPSSAVAKGRATYMAFQFIAYCRGEPAKEHPLASAIEHLSNKG